MLAAPDQQISLTDPDCRSMATSGRGSGVVGYNVRDERARPLYPLLPRSVAAWLAPRR